MSTNKFWGGVGQAREFAAAFDKAGGTEADITELIQDEGKMLRVIKVARRRKPCVEILLPYDGDIEIPSVPTPFVVRHRFLFNSTDKNQVKISGIGQNFVTWFMNVTIKSHVGSTLTSARLIHDCDESVLIDKLGVKRETSIPTVFYLMTQQPWGERGVLRNDGKDNIFYCHNGVAILTVCLKWEHGWSIGVSTLGSRTRNSKVFYQK